MEKKTIRHHIHTVFTSVYFCINYNILYKLHSFFYIVLHIRKGENTWQKMKTIYMNLMTVVMFDTWFCSIVWALWNNNMIEHATDTVINPWK